MDFDLLLAILVIFFASISACCGGRRISRDFDSIRMPLFVVVILFTAWYASSWTGRVENIALFSVGSAVLLSNLTPVLASFLAGLAWEMPGIPPVRRVLGLGTLVALAGMLFLAPMLRPILKPVSVNGLGRWSNGVCLQTHEASCGAAATATLLREVGITATEQELVEDCLTSQDGTEPLSLYRALMRQTQGKGMKPKIAAKDPQAWSSLGQYPILAMVAPADSDELSPSRSGRLRHLLGRSSEGHAVAILGRRADGDYVIGDPSSGRVVWTPYEMSLYFSGQAICLTKTLQ